jgi:lipoyl(octanoyl) transferase
MTLETVQWRMSREPVPYEEALAAMEARAAAIAAGSGPELVWLLEHPPLYTAGTSARPADLLEPARFPVFHTGRGGQYTYHGPGQLIAYVMLDLSRRGRDVRAFAGALENWVIATLAVYGVKGERRDGRVGVWVPRPEMGTEDKIAAIGVRVRRWVTFHGLSFNVSPDLSHYSGIVPCGIRGYGVTSLADLGIQVSVEDAAECLRHEFAQHFDVRLGKASH